NDQVILDLLETYWSRSSGVPDVIVACARVTPCRAAACGSTLHIHLAPLAITLDLHCARRPAGRPAIPKEEAVLINYSIKLEG
uniref:Uncharacterized protein n=1 Tax=Aegilops tauschii subsp. strangulata TaxID=200361 RepID=A0A453LTB1_AEGTS